MWKATNQIRKGIGQIMRNEHRRCEGQDENQSSQRQALEAIKLRIAKAKAWINTSEQGAQAMQVIGKTLCKIEQE